MTGAVPDGSVWERELRDRMTQSGWAVTRAAGSGTWEGDSADIVGIRGGEVLILEVKSVPSGNFSRDVRSDSEQLRNLYGKAKDDGGSTDAGFAVREKGSGDWYYTDYRCDVLTRNDLQKKLYEVTL